MIDDIVIQMQREADAKKALGATTEELDRIIERRRVSAQRTAETVLIILKELQNGPQSTL